MQKKKLATKIASILLSAAMLVSTTMTALATDEAVSVAAEQTEVQTVSDTEDATLEASEEVAEEVTADTESTEEETAAEEEIIADEVITEESTTEAAQENVEEAQVLDAEEVQALDADEVVAVADENDIALTSDTAWHDVAENSNIQYRTFASNGGQILEFGLKDTGKQEALPDYTSYDQAPWYKTLRDSNRIVTEVVIGAGITGIGDYNFDNSGHAYDKLTTVELPSTVTTIGESAFASTKSLTEVSTSQCTEGGVCLHNITSIGTNAFAGSGIKSVRFKCDVEIGHMAFQGCSSLESVVADGNVAFSGHSNFDECTQLTQFVCKGTIENVLPNAFANCSSLTTWDVSSVEYIGDNVFRDCSALQGITLTGVTGIGEEAFHGSGIRTIKFSETDLTFKETSFSGASVLVSICYPGTKAQWEAIVKNGNVDNLDQVNVHYRASTVIDAKGKYYCEACGQHYRDRTDQDSDSGTETDHKWGAWKTKSKATVFKAEVQMRTCSDCGETETRTVGKKLTPTITVNATKIWLQKGQKTSAFKVSGLANGDSVKSYKSGNKKIFTVTNKGVIKAGKKVGKAKLTITLASGKKKVVTVQVQKRQVKTWAIKNLPTKVTVKKGATYTLSPVVILITSTHKVTYKSSNKKVATVTSAGKIKGVKKGTATITVKSGKITKKVKVTVK